MTMSHMTMPTSADAIDRMLADLVDRFIDRLQAGEAADLDAFAAEYPDQAETLRTLLQTAASMDELRRSALRGPTAPGLELRLDAGRLGDYRIIREVGRGGMGIVYEAEQVSLGRRVALKVLPNAASMDPRQLARFHVEAQAAAALHHPQIVPIFAVGCEQSVHYYAMQFIEGCSLADVIAGRNPGGVSPILGVVASARLAAQAAEALEHAHSLGILHRDVKPANLLIDTGGHLWVADFGLARFLDGGDLTQTGDVIGTIRYLSPEQAAGRRVLDPRSDVYSLGATLYELLTLRPAFDGHDRQDLLRRIVQDEPVAPRRIDPSIPSDLETIVSKAIAKDANDRYRSAGEMADDLRRFLDGRPILARRLGPSAWVARWAGRHRAGVLATAVVLAVVLGGLAVGLALLWKEQAKTRGNLRVALVALDEFCLSINGMEVTRDPERMQELRALQRKALAIYERVLLQNPNDPEARWAAARADHRVANNLSQSPQFAEAEQAYRAASNHLAVLKKSGAEPLGWSEEQADLLADWGALLAGRKPEAQGLLRRALANHLRLSEEFPEKALFRKAVSRDCLELSKTIGILRPAEAEEKERLQRRAVELRRSFEAGSFSSRVELAEAYGYLGHLLGATGRAEEGKRVMGMAQTLIKVLETDFPTDPACRGRIVAIKSLLAVPRYCEKPADPEETLRTCRDANADQARLASDFPFIPDFRARLAWSHHILSRTLRELDRAAESEADERRSVEIFERLIHDHPSVEHYRRWMVIASEDLAMHLAKSDRPGEASRYLRRAIEMLPGSSVRVAQLRAALEELEARAGRPASPSVSIHSRSL
jgi:eukaryotic-like serine/threonine-protein kinase